MPPRRKAAPPAAAPPKPMSEDEDDELSAPAPIVKKRAPPAKTSRGRRKAVPEEEEEEEDEIVVVPEKSKRGTGKRAVVVEEVGETQMEDVVVGKEKKKGKREVERFKLEEARSVEAERLLEEFKKNSAEVVAESQRVITALQEEVAKQTALADESRAYKKKLQARDAEIAKLQAKNADHTKAMTAAQNEIQVLTAKLAAAQQQQKIPGSAIKTSGGVGGRGIIPSSKTGGGADQAAWAAHAKEDLYGDLTNLVILSIKKEPESRLFECLQTGTNGALHFKLSVRESTVARKQKPPATGDAMEDEEGDDEYVFIPMLDEKRDQLVISLLPDYLQSEISFSRDHAARFYQKIHVILQKPPVNTQEEEDETEEDTEEDTEEEGDESVAADTTVVADTSMADD